jgi:hypothetical protein
MGWKIPLSKMEVYSYEELSDEIFHIIKKENKKKKKKVNIEF